MSPRRQTEESRPNSEDGSAGRRSSWEEQPDPTRQQKPSPKTKERPRDGDGSSSAQQALEKDQAIGGRIFGEKVSVNLETLEEDKSNEMVLRRSERVSSHPKHFKDYIVHTARHKTPFPNSPTSSDSSDAYDSLFTLHQDYIFLGVLVYVDDLIIVGNSSSHCDFFKGYLDQCFRIKDLGPLKYFLDIEVTIMNSSIFLSQRKYVLDILTECGMLASRPSSFPMEQHHRLSTSFNDLLSDPGKSLARTIEMLLCGFFVT
ncbi:uncharacterized protein LOC116188785 [Punica granatum]|uniref:Uncharacterized protein LOC116188785 n=1 Tax=Punica granatum TaxID=22663 RepID=A0A6P8BWX1_PUNGR|nr:uncharacterized protein LOC116188785 [Punica granatum]